jgi:2-methylcitrate dehydratase PrpD
MSGEVRVSTQLVSHLRPFRDDPWAPAVLRRTELCLLDSLSCYAAGRILPHFAPSAVVASHLFGRRAIASPAEIGPSPFLMAYLYGQAANALDYDDTLVGHPGAPIVGAVLSVAIREGLSTDRLLRGIAAGYEVHTILGAAANPSPERAAQVRSVGVWDTVAGAVGICAALGLEDSMIERALGVAVSHSMLPYTGKWYERPVPAMKNNLGWAAAGAVMSADLAIAGLTGVTNPLEGDAGMWRMAGSDRWSFGENLCKKPAVLRTGFKIYPVCWHLQEYLKTFSSLLASIPADDEVVEIILFGSEEIVRFCQHEIVAPADVAFSLPAAFSLLVSRVEPGPKWDSVDDRSEVLKHRELFRYEPSGNRAISLRSRAGLEFHAAVAEWDHLLDPADGGLDEAGVLAKHERLVDAELRAGAAEALAAGNSLSAGRVPDRLYRSISQMMGQH